MPVGEEFGNIDLIRVDSARDVERLKLIAEELDNDTGREVYLAFYSGVETVSQVAERLGITIQLASYHVDKLVLAGLLKERGVRFFSVKGKPVKRYEPSKAAILIVPSLQYLKSNSELSQAIHKSLSDILKKILPQILAPAGVFLAVFFSPRIASALQLLSTGRTRPSTPPNLQAPASPNTSSGIIAGLARPHTVASLLTMFGPLELTIVGIIFALVTWLIMRRFTKK